MKIGVTRERRNHERWVAAIPAAIRKYADLGYSVVGEQSAGAGAYITDVEYVAAGATIAPARSSSSSEALPPVMPGWATFSFIGPTR